jgi:uncharacterized membrane protein YgcG
MLDSMRKQGASVFLYLVFGLLIAIFVININPGSKSGEGGCNTGAGSIVTVDGARVGKNAYLVAYSNRYIQEFMRMWNFRTSKEREFAAVEMLIRREILAQAAADRGLRVTDDMVMEEIKKGYFFVGGQRIPMGENIFDNHDDGTKTWNINKFKQWYGGLNVSKNSYVDEQTRGMQAALMQELLLASVRVSKEEAKDAYIYQKSTVSYDLVAFEPSAYRTAMKLTDADIARYLAAHEEEVKARFKSDERTYKDVKPQVKLRQIFIAKADDKKPEPAPEAPAAGSGSGSGSAAGAGSGSAAKPDANKDDKKDVADKKKPGMPLEEAKAKLEAARADIAANKKKFAEAVAQLADEAGRANGGDLGWRTQDSPNLGDKALNDQVKALKPGEMTAVVTVADKGVYLIKVEEIRPLNNAKDLTYDQVKTEIAAELARVEWSKEAAKRAAIAALASAREGTGKNLGDLYQESMDEKIRRAIEQQRQMGGGGMPPDLELPGTDQPMAWKPGDDAGSSGTAGSATGSGSAAGSAAGGGGSGAGSGAPPTTLPPPTGAPQPKAIEPTKDQLPAFAEIPKPALKKFGPFPRVPQLPGIGKELVPVVFDELTAGMLAKRVYEVDGSYVLVQVTTKGEASMEEFEKDAPALIGRMRMMRAAYLVEDFLKAKCQQLDKDGKIAVHADLKQPATDEETKKPVAVYKPCMTFR